MGNFPFEHRIAQLATQVSAERKLDWVRSVRLVRKLVWDHELFHFRLNLFTLQQELSSSQALYLRYHRDVYRRVVCTSHCVEEALANRMAHSRCKPGRGRSKVDGAGIARDPTGGGDVLVELQRLPG
jgi:hypothetical protein